ncbi:Dipeptide transport system permease protein DppC (TC 3.A.1.5.2) [Microbacterium esteraromaticum]|uniref:Dipeptide transport system permease protein DppC (TC 3.A.1.5.2) n=1 Tax=Microbacterium esteraromaticum TaxID=57043 RepID=A0A1R4JDG3_9MICO|nr:ABC transporter permease [Microbacterium esteraromaticum]SJN29783.1 Dipeptide transport system permease protein DppC (TC 3.A.1.5.2) [Microbacterium esteraromaticum]
MSRPDARAEHFVAPVDTTSIPVDVVRIDAKPSNLWLDAWRDLRTRPLFWVSAAFVLLVIVVAVFPSLFTNVAPNNGCTLSKSNGGPQAGHPLGLTRQGCDVYSRIIWGARTSVVVGLLATIISTVIGMIMGAYAGFYGGWLDSLLSRIGDIFFTIPYIIAAIVVMSVLPNRNEFVLAFAIGGFAWASTARIMRAEVLRVKQSDFVMGAEAVGLSRFRTLLSHVLPNSMAPVIVVATLALAGAIVAESVLSFLGVGLGGSTMSWGLDISQAQTNIRTAPMALFWPSLALTLTVLAFITLGELLRDAVDPKARAKR